MLWYRPVVQADAEAEACVLILFVGALKSSVAKIELHEFVNDS